LCETSFKTSAYDTVVAQDQIVSVTGGYGFVGVSADDHIVARTRVDGCIGAAQIGCPHQRRPVQRNTRNHAGDHAALSADPAVVAQDDVVARAARYGCVARRAAHNDIVAVAGGDVVAAAVRWGR